MGALGCSFHELRQYFNKVDLQINGRNPKVHKQALSSGPLPDRTGSLLKGSGDCFTSTLVFNGLPTTRLVWSGERKAVRGSLL